MNPTRKDLLCFALLFLCATPVYSQTATPSTPSTAGQSPADQTPDCLEGLVKAIKFHFDNPGKEDPRKLSKGNLTRWPSYVCQFTADPIRLKLLAQAEEKRQDKQPGASGNSSGSTSLVSKGTSPWLLGFALEHGGLTQSTSGNTVTFRGNAVNSISALLNSSYLGSYQLSKKDPLVKALSKLSFGVSFDSSSDQGTTTQGFTPSTTNFSGFSAKYELYNHRDPRDKYWVEEWNKLALDQSKSAQPALMTVIARDDTVITSLLSETYKEKFALWMNSVSTAVDGLPDKPSPEQVRNVVQDAANSFHDNLWNLPKIQAAIGHLTSSMSAFLEAQDKTVDKIRGTPLFTIEYNFTRQLTANNMKVTATEPGQQIPNLSNINLVFEQGITGGNTPEFTFNAGATWFNSSDSATPRRGRVRDYRASAEIDFPLKEITNVGRPVLSFSGQFLSLLNEPLGQQVAINGVTVNRTGNMGVFQTKLSIPVKGTGVKIPISFTYATRTELVKEADKRGNIGITFDLDTLFSKSN